MSESDPKVSVCMIAYNHEAFIEQAVESVLAQEVDFDFELVIGEDCSKDGTGSLLEEYALTHPRVVRLFRRTRNIGMMGNLLATIGACRGNYIAFLEGDDYWCDTQKLRKQVAVLDRDPSLTMVFTSMWVLKDSVRAVCSWGEDGRTRYNLDDALRGNIGSTLTVMYRKIYREGYPEWVSRTRLGDWTLHTLQAMHGDAFYIDEPTGVYRVHAGGAWSGKKQIGQCRMKEDTNVLLLRHLPGWVPRAELKARLFRTRCDIVYYGLVYGTGVLQGLRALLLALLSGKWPFRSRKDALRGVMSVVPGFRWTLSKLRKGS